MTCSTSLPDREFKCDQFLFLLISSIGITNAFFMSHFGPKRSRNIVNYRFYRINALKSWFLNRINEEFLFKLTTEKRWCLPCKGRFKMGRNRRFSCTEVSTIEVGICSRLFSRPPTSYLDSSSLAALYLVDLIFFAILLVSEVVTTPPQKTFVNIGPYHLLYKKIEENYFASNQDTILANF